MNSKYRRLKQDSDYRRIDECIEKAIVEHYSDLIINEGMFDSIKNLFGGMKSVGNLAKDKAQSAYNKGKEAVGQVKGAYEQGKLEQDKKNVENDVKKLVRDNIKLFMKYKEYFKKDGAMVFANMLRKEMAELG